MRYLGFQSANFAIILRWEANSSYSQKSEFADEGSYLVMLLGRLNLLFRVPFAK